MDINSVITKEEFETIKDFSYERLSVLISRIIKLSVEESLRTLPHVITHLNNQSGYLKSLSDKFYEDNKDLVSRKELVGKVIEKIEAENPGETFEKILTLAAIESRKQVTSSFKIQTYSKDKSLESMDKKLGTI